jgi:hypothetical protein
MPGPPPNVTPPLREAHILPCADGPAPPAERVTLPGYEILAELGRGGMGVVYLARQTRLNRVVALKMVLSGGCAGAADLARFRTEAEAVARLQHPGIVQIYEVGEHNGLPYLALEYVEGGSLADRFDGKPLPAPEAARLVEALARAMHHAHLHRVVHRDLKPGNVLLQKDVSRRGAESAAKEEAARLSSASSAPLRETLGTPKITDFGLAKMLDEIGQTQTGSALGTPSYMAPEQAGGKRGVTGPAADVYALGAVLYEMLTGRPPFVAETALDTMMLVVSEEPTPPRRLRRKVPRDLETVCLKCLEKDPHRRYATAEALADDLHAFQCGEPIQARPLGRFGRLVRWAAHRPALAATLCGLVVFYANHLLLMSLGLEGEGGNFHFFVTGVVLVWAAGAVGFQQLMSRPRWRGLATYGWAALDVILLTLIPLRANGPTSGLVVLYPLLIAGAGLRFRPPLVWFVTALSVASYLILQADAIWRRPEKNVAATSHNVIIFVLSLVVMGLIISLLLRRFRLALSKD